MHMQTGLGPGWDRGRGRLREMYSCRGSSGVKKGDPGHYPCSISASQADGRLTGHYTS